jgi:hypothetical protein
MIAEIMLRQRSGHWALRIGPLRAARIGARVRIDGRDDWVILRLRRPRLSGTVCRVECARRPARQRLAA